MHCPYDCYQRACSRHGLTVGQARNDAARFNAAILSVLTSTARKNPEIAGPFLDSAREHLFADYAMMVQFRL